MARGLVFDNPQSPLGKPGFQCDKCGTPANPWDLVYQDGYYISRVDGCLNRHSEEQLDTFAEPDLEDFPLKARFGGK